MHACFLRSLGCREACLPAPWFSFPTCGERSLADATTSRVKHVGGECGGAGATLFGGVVVVHFCCFFFSRYFFPVLFWFTLSRGRRLLRFVGGASGVSALQSCMHVRTCTGMMKWTSHYSSYSFRASFLFFLCFARLLQSTCPSYNADAFFTFLRQLSSKFLLAWVTESFDPRAHLGQCVQECT